MEGKGKEGEEIGLFGKLVVWWKKEYVGVMIDGGERGYWVGKIEGVEWDERELVEKVKGEIGGFVY